MPFLLALLLLSLPLTNHADACRDQFVQCVQQTGNPAQCQSTYQHCQRGPVPVDTAMAEGLQIQAKLAPVDDLSGVELWVANPSKERVKLDDMWFQVRCNNGEMQTAEFSLAAEIPAEMALRRVGSTQIVCMQQGGAAELLDETTTKATGLASVASEIIYFFPCVNGESRSLTLTYHQQGKGYYRWQSSNGVSGTLTDKVLHREDFAELACEPLKPAEPSYIEQAKRELRQLLEGNSPKPSERMKVKSAGGVRG